MVRVRRTADEWLIEVRGEAIGRADTAGEAEALAVFWLGAISGAPMTVTPPSRL